MSRDTLGKPGEPVRAKTFQTTLLDLILGIDEYSATEQESLATALRLLSRGRIRLVTRQSELGTSSWLSRTDLEELIRENTG